MRIINPNLLSTIVGEPLLKGSARWPEWGMKERKCIREALEGEWGIGSASVARLERRFADVHCVPPTHAVVPVANGTVALQLALEALDIGVGDEVLVPALTWQATAGAVLDVNATPVLIDVDADTWTIDPDKVQAELEVRAKGGRPLPKALIAVHLYHRAAHLERLAVLCHRFGLWLLEDCAHAVGGAWEGRALGTYGVCGTFSTQSSKTLPSGEGGLVVTGVPLLEQRLRSLVSCGRKAEPTIDPSVRPDGLTAHWRQRVDESGIDAWPLQSGNYRLSGVAAGLLLAQLDRFPRQQAKRQKTLGELGDGRLDKLTGIRALPPQPALTSPFAYMFGFTFDPDEFGGMDSELFRQVLTHLLGGYLALAPYDPLGGGRQGYNSPVYNPQTKRRHRLDAEYWAAIDPGRFHLPVCHDVAQTGVTIQHSFLRERGAAAALVKALRIIRREAPRLVAHAK